MKQKRLSAFTLFELMVAMVISSLVIALGYSAWQMMQQQVDVHRKQSNDLLRLVQLTSTMGRDFYGANRIRFSRMDLQFEGKYGSRHYFISDSLVVRIEDERKDSFLMGNSDLRVAYFPVNDSSGLVKEFSIEFELNGEALPLHLKKEYPAASLIEAELNTDHTWPQ